MSKTQELNRIDCPWPGPVPYGEENADQFLGRGPEVTKLLDLVERQQLNVLIALSGVGKSSLLQAGLVPALRYAREETGGFGPVLVAREWSGLRGTSPAALLMQAVRKAIVDFHARSSSGANGDQARTDAERLVKVELSEVDLHEGASEGALRKLVDYVQRLCNETGEIVLILDQAEELLGSGLSGPSQDLERDVLRVIGTLFGREKRLKILLSLREEYLGRISLLAQAVEGLDKRIFRLDPMPRRTVRDVLLQVSELTDGRILFEDEQVVDTLLLWLGGTEAQEANGDTKSPVDLLRLQALLIGVFNQIQENASVGKLLINKELLERYQQALEERLGRRIPAEQLARQALENHIERLLQDAPVTEPPVGPGRRLMKRVLVRMAPWLSSPGGFKRHVAAEELIFNSTRDDLEVLGVSNKPEAIRGAILGLFQDRSGLLAVELEKEDKGSLSGDALIYEPGWSLQEAATMLVIAALEVLDLLARKYVLKSSHGTFELVHDGFGPALFEWAERERLKLSDTLASIVSRRGETFRWPLIEEQTLQRVSWLGCSLNDKEFKRVRFVGCILTGSIFTSCVFEDCVFEDCDLRGTVFLESRWCDVRWASCLASSVLFVGCLWGGVEIESSILENGTLTGLSMNGDIRIEDCSLQFAQICKIKVVDNTSGRIEIRSSDLQNSLLEERRVDLSEECNENGILRRKGTPMAPQRGALSVAQGS